MKIQVHFDLKIPQVPNFILIEQKQPGLRQDGWKEPEKVSIADLTDEQLEAIGESWTNELINLARTTRNARKAIGYGQD